MTSPGGCSHILRGFCRGGAKGSSAPSGAGDFLNAQKVTKDALRNYVSKNFLSRRRCVISISLPRDCGRHGGHRPKGELPMRLSSLFRCALLSCGSCSVYRQGTQSSARHPSRKGRVQRRKPPQRCPPLAVSREGVLREGKSESPPSGGFFAYFLRRSRK